MNVDLENVRPKNYIKTFMTKPPVVKTCVVDLVAASVAAIKFEKSITFKLEPLYLVVSEKVLSLLQLRI